ncbi:hypothetical protein BGZ99_001222 [Dissophora globulifera]|uniref:BZIP domain-containing protein n=1 Tax=Dissophora globulifera TaxID=979702 RepID=A0A9P6RUQ3_9FUNG|nr:hypothetical protein BGZ99_001222 [Dissophora globulifera]
MSNPMFDDFIELDLLETTETTSDMFAYYLGGAIDLDDSSADLGAAAAALTSTEDEPALAQDLVIKQEDVSDSESSMLLDPVPLTQLELSATAQQPSLVFGENTLNLVSPDQLTIAPQATISLSTATSSPLSTTASTTAATGSSDGQDAPMTETSPRASSTSKRSSPEPAPSARKHAKTESVSKSKSSISSRKSSTSSTTSTVTPSSPKTAGATQSTSSSTSSESTATSPEPTAESLTSTANTTLSPATLQFLLQQQQETPLIPQLFTGKLSREEIEATLARLLESTKHLIASSDDSAKIKEEAPMSDDESDDNMDGLEGGEASEQTHGLKTQPGIKTDDIPSSTDLKKMTSKERRQLRNKISARNFRVRRKEYIFTLEGQVLQHKTEARHLREAVTLVQDENVRLKTELEEARQQLAAITISSSAASAGSDVAVVATCEPAQAAISAAPLSKENQTLLSSILNRNVTSALSPNAKSNLTLTLARPQSPILTPNLHKDVPNSSSGSTSQNSWKDKNPIMVHTTLVPEICFGEEFQFDHKAARSKEDEMIDRPWMKLNGLACESKSTVNPFWISGVVLDLMQTFTCMTMSMLRPDAQLLFEGDADLADVVDVAETSEVDSTAERDWELQQDLWALSQVEDEDEMTDEQMQLLYDLSQLQISTSRTEPVTSVQEDPNMLEWLYESMMARLVDMDLQSSQEPSPFTPFSDAHLA